MIWVFKVVVLNQGAVQGCCKKNHLGYFWKAHLKKTNKTHQKTYSLLFLWKIYYKLESLQEDGRTRQAIPQTAGCKARACVVVACFQVSTTIKWLQLEWFSFKISLWFSS